MRRISFVVLSILLIGAGFGGLSGCEFGGSSDSNSTILPIAPSKYKYESCLGNSVQYSGSDSAPSTRGKFPNGDLKTGTYVPGEVLVKFKAGVGETAALNYLGAARATSLNSLNKNWDGWMKVSLDDQDVQATMADMAEISQVEYVQPNYIYHALAVPNDPGYEQLWGMKNNGQTINDPAEGPITGVSGVDMGMESAWDSGTDCSSILVAVVDTGVNYQQEDLSANMWDGTGCPSGYDCSNHGYDFVENDNDPMDRNGHGTHVAGSIGAVGDNGLGVAGVCWTAKLMAVRALDSSGTGDSTSVAAGMNFAAQAGAKVVNLSLGGEGDDQLMYDAAVNIRNAGAIIVAAAGNSTLNNDVTFSHPGCFDLDNIINTAALAADGSLASFSNYGAVSVDVAGPGSSIYSTLAGSMSEYTIYDSLWQFNTGSHWGWGNCIYEYSSVAALANPADYCSGGVYQNNADDQAWVQLSDGGIDLSSHTGAFMTVWVNLLIAEGDYLRIMAKADGGSPFSSGEEFASLTDTSTDGEFIHQSIPMDSCMTADCSFGVRLQTNDSGQGGAAFLTDGNIKIYALTAASDQYGYESGTSMASPNVAGVAALLWSQYPQATYKDIILAIFDGTEPMPSLAGKTCTGGLVNAKNSLELLADWYSE